MGEMASAENELKTGLPQSISDRCKANNYSCIPEKRTTEFLNSCLYMTGQYPEFFFKGKGEITQVGITQLQTHFLYCKLACQQ